VLRHNRIAIAAAHIHLSQPAVTQAIARIEKTLGARLFDRKPDGMFATEVGEIFGRRVTRTLAYLKTAEVLAYRKSPRQATKRRAGFHRLATATQLRTLIAVSRAGSFSQAARGLGVSQPAVHRAARDLENLSGMVFFEPVRRGMALTPQAETFAFYVRLAAAEMRQGIFEVSEYLGRDSTRIAVGTLPLSRTSLLPQAMDALLKEAKSHVQMQCVDGPYDSLLHDLRQGDLDFLIGALRDPPPAADIVQETLFEDTLSVVASASHPLVGRHNLTLKDTLAYPWIAPPKSTPSGSYLFEHLGIPDLPDTPVRIVSSSLVLVRGLMMRGDYVTIMSPRQIEVERELGLLVPLPIPLPDSARAIGLTFRRDWMPTPSQKRLLDLIRTQCVTGHD